MLCEAEGVEHQFHLERDKSTVNSESSRWIGLDFLRERERENKAKAKKKKRNGRWALWPGFFQQNSCNAPKGWDLVTSQPCWRICVSGESTSDEAGVER